MKPVTTTLVLGLVVAMMMGTPCMARDVEPPFTWEGKGVVSFISEEGTEEIDFQFELSVDEQGMIEGHTSNKEGISKIKHVFYAEERQYDFPGFFSRKVVLVLILDEHGNRPMLSVLNGRLLVDRFFYGEVMLTRYEEGSATAKGLGVGNPKATLMEGSELPYRLKTLLNENCLPIGTVKIEGDYESEDTSAAAATTEPWEDDAIALFNGKDFEGWHIYLQNADADPENVWQVKNGEILCSGNPTGFLRTKQEYRDFKLTLAWKWPQKPGNSGVLLRMSGEEKIWPPCMEAQLMHRRAGDFVGMGCTFNENKAKEGSPISYTPRMNDSSEKELGGWNTYEITCKGDTIEATVNGRLQNRATGVTIHKGYIGFQSEGVPIMFRNIKLTPLR
jgi:hypothetical protein